MFTPHFERVCFEPANEYSLRDPIKGMWLCVGTDGGLRFDSITPVSLTTLYERSDVGSKEFARDLLNWMKEQAETGEVIDKRFVDVPLVELQSVCVYRFMGQRPVMLPTGLEVNEAFDTEQPTFEVRGPIGVVDFYLKRYEAEHPPALHGTKYKILNVTDSSKTVRVTSKARMRELAHA